MNTAPPNPALARVCIAIFALALIFCLVTKSDAANRSSQSSISDPQSQPFGDFVGVNAKFGQGEPMADLALLPELGVKWVRDSVLWTDMEPAAGEYAPFPPDFQNRLAFYKAHGIGVVYGLCYDNQRAYPDTPANPHNSLNPEAFGRYAVHIAQLLKASRVRFVLEIWNEPQNFNFMKEYGGTWTGAPPSPWLPAYVKLVDATVAAVKGYDPNITVIDDDDAWIIHYWFLEAGLPRALDGFAVHPYFGPWPERAPCDWNSDFCKPFMVVDKDGSFVSAVRRLRAQGQLKMGKTPQIWITEWGWSLAMKSWTEPITQDVQAGYLPRAFILAYASGVQAMTWFSLYDGPDGSWGLTANDGTKRKSFWAYRTMTHQLGDCTLVRQVEGADHPTTGVQAYLFHGPAGYKLVAWIVNGGPQSSVPVCLTTSGPPHIIDDLGYSVPVSAAKGQASLTLTPSPIYISGVGANPKLVPQTLQAAETPRP